MPNMCEKCGKKYIAMTKEFVKSGGGSNMELCPHCEQLIDVYSEFISDYLEKFEMVCPQCGETIDVEVEETIEFDLSPRIKNDQ